MRRSLRVVRIVVVGRVKALNVIIVTDMGI
jgi:hypothetical protein